MHLYMLPLKAISCKLNRVDRDETVPYLKAILHSRKKVESIGFLELNSDFPIQIKFNWHFPLQFQKHLVMQTIYSCEVMGICGFLTQMSFDAR